MYSPSPRGGLRLGEKLHARTKYLTYRAIGADYGRACPQPVTVLLPFSHSRQTLAVQLEQMGGILFGLGG